MKTDQNVGADLVINIRQSLGRKMASRTNVLGSQLGGVISKEIYPVRLSEHGGLKMFVEAHLRQFVTWIGRTSDIPGDDIYELNITDESMPSSGWTNVLDLKGSDFWTSFSNPNVNAFFAAEKALQSLYRASGAEAQQDWIIINKLNEDNYRDAARKFIENMSAEITVDADVIIGESGFNAPFISFLRERCGMSAYREWEIFRIQYVVENLSRQLRSIEFENVTINKIATALSQSHSARKDLDGYQMQTFSTPLKFSKHIKKIERQSDKIHSNNRDITLVRLRNVLHASIELMSESQLKEIDIPAGIVIDLLK